jgi:hypothetical protein
MREARTRENLPFDSSQRKGLREGRGKESICCLLLAPFYAKYSPERQTRSVQRREVRRNRRAGKRRDKTKV